MSAANLQGDVLELSQADRVDLAVACQLRPWLPRPGYRIVRTYPRYGFAEVAAPGLRALLLRLRDRLRSRA